MDFDGQLKHYRERIEQGLDRLVPTATTRPSRLHTAMRYSLQAGGKRLRPVLVLAAADACGAAIDALPAAIALECLHTYSLIHDDLPCMDNDDLRRGHPTAHKKFDEATALLAGDALLTFAFQLLPRHYATTPTLCVALAREIGDAAGSEQLIGGQMEDLLAEKKADVTAADLESIHHQKTGAMLSAALVVGGLCGGADDQQLARLRRIGRHLGLAFQITDDILDATADTATLGKTAGKDAQADKTTYVKIHGLEASAKHAASQTKAALAALSQLAGDTTFLAALATHLGTRSH